jgi:hypothetical protein
MKTRLTLCLILLSATVGLHAEDAAPRGQTPAGEQSEHPTPESILARQVSEIATSSSASRKTKAKRIASAVHLAVISATTDVKDPDQVLKIALDLATAAAEAAPNFAEAIRDAIISIPSIASIAGAAAELQTAIKAAAASNERTVVEFSSTPPRPPQNPDFGAGSGGVSVVSPSH